MWTAAERENFVADTQAMRKRVVELSAGQVVRDPQGNPVTLPLGQVASITPSLGPAQIDHLDRDPALAQFERGRETGNAGSDNSDFGRNRHWAPVPSPA